MLCSAGRPRRAVRRIRATPVVAAVVLLGAAAAATSCAPPPPVCSVEVREAQKERFIETWGAWGPPQQWMAGWYWSNPANCVEPDPETPPPVVPESPLVVLLPLGAVAMGAGALVVTRRRAGRA
jgi:hypothetical protein